MKKYLLLLPFAILAVSCLSEETDFAGFTSAQVVQLMTADTLKPWRIGAVQQGGEPLQLDGSDSCLYQFAYFFTSFTAEDSITVYLRNDPDLICATDTIGFFWTPIEEEGEVGFASPQPRLIVGTDSGNIIARLNVLTANEMEWELLREDGETPRSPTQQIFFESLTD